MNRAMAPPEPGIIRRMGRPTIGICEDDPDLRSVLSRALEAEGMIVRTVSTGHEAVEAFTAAPPDAIVLDVGLPDADGRDVCQALRAHGLTTPVLFLTARGSLTDRLSGFHAGGDDYLGKPFALAELLVRIDSLLRRAHRDHEHVDAGHVRLDPATHAVRIGDRSQALTPTEFRLFAVLAARVGEIVRRDELIAAGWPEGAIVHDNTLDTYVGRLRRKLRQLESVQQISTAHGVGYMLQ
jgi:two-component system, OmpR family, response regulator